MIRFEADVHLCTLSEPRERVREGGNSQGHFHTDLLVRVSKSSKLVENRLGAKRFEISKVNFFTRS